MKYQREKAHDVFKEMIPLLTEHWNEIARYKDILLEPDFPMYLAMEDSGALRVFTARDEDNKLTGYAVFFVKHNIHYKSSLQAVQDILYVDKEKRGFGAKFILWCDEQLRKEGVQAVMQHIKKEHNWGEMAERLGYELVDLIYVKRLDK